MFFIRDFYFENDFILNFTVTWDQTYVLMTSTEVESIEQFNEQSRDASLSIAPSLTYNFSKYVSGTLTYSYRVTDNKSTGSNTENKLDFGVNIRIVG